MHSEEIPSSTKTDREMIGKQLTQLTQTIRETQTYKRYHKALDALKNDKALYQRYNEFQQQNILLEVQNSEHYDTEIEELHAKYNDLLVDRVIAEFLTAQQQICRMVRDISDSIAVAVDMDLSYFDL